MKTTLRASTFPIACVLACGPAFAQIALDTASLPRAGGGKSIYASAPTTIFTSADSVALTIDATRKALNAAGWQNYEAPFTSKSNDPNSRIMSFKKASQGLTVFITVAPAQNNATSVQYNAIGLETDLPFPRDATDIEYSPQRPQLNCFTDEPVEKTLAFFGSELAAQGWSAWSTKDVAKIPAGEKIGVSSDKGAYATLFATASRRYG